MPAYIDSQGQLETAYLCLRPLPGQFVLSVPYQVCSINPPKTDIGTASPSSSSGIPAASIEARESVTDTDKVLRPRKRHKRRTSGVLPADRYGSTPAAEVRDQGRHACYLQHLQGALYWLIQNEAIRDQADGLQQPNPSGLLPADKHAQLQWLSTSTAPHSKLSCPESCSSVKPAEQPVDSRAQWLTQTAASLQGDRAQRQVSKELPATNLFNKLTENAEGCEMLAEAHDHMVVIPAHAQLLMSDLLRIGSLVPSSVEERFDCIVVDPPWENASAKRAAHYSSLTSRHLLFIPIRKLLNQETGLVVLWMTNRSRLWQFMEADLLPAWGLHIVATWLWLKVTDDGQPVSPLEASHRRPYEVALLLRPEACHVPSVPSPTEHFVFMSVPGEHSRKPHLGALLMPFLPNRPRCAELFARELWPGWTSWGDDVLHFQGLERFQAAAPAFRYAQGGAIA